MKKRQINLEKVIGSLGENTFPNIHYFMNESHQNPDGNVDGSNDGLYQGLVRGEGIDELGIDNNVLESQHPILELCKIILEKNGTLFFGLGLLYSEGFSEVAVDEEWIEIDEDLGGYYPNTGGYGIYLSNEGWNYGYYSCTLFLCFMPPEEKYYYLNDDEEDKVAMKIIKNIDEMDIFD